MKSQLYLKNKEKKFEVKTVIKILKNLKNERTKKKKNGKAGLENCMKFDCLVKIIPYLHQW